MKWTRSTRDRINTEIRDMSHEELQRWLEAQRPTDPFLAELFGRREALEARRPFIRATGTR